MVEDGGFVERKMAVRGEEDGGFVERKMAGSWRGRDLIQD
jgi:hypothetical protein